MEKLSRKEAARLLGISIPTLNRRMKAGHIGFTKIGEGQFARVLFSRADLGLPADDANAVPTAATATAAPKQEAVPPALNLEQGLQPQQMTHDSLGNEIRGPKRTFSLLGPHPQIERSTDTLGARPIWEGRPPMIGTDGYPVQHAGSSNHPLVAVHKPIEGSRPRSRHPNYNRQAFLDAIRRDLRRGWSR